MSFFKAIGSYRRRIILKDNIYTLKSLKQENKILKAEINRLSRLLKAKSAAEPSGASKKISKPSVESVLIREVALLSSSSYTKYIFSKITGGSVYAFGKTVWNYFRKFRLVSTIMKFISYALTILGTGAFVIFISGALVFIIPLIVAFCAALYFLSTVSRKKAFKKIEKYIEGKNIFIIFCHKNRQLERGSKFRECVEHVAKDTKNQNFVIIISPHIFSSAGFSGNERKLYSVAKFERENICMVRKHSFFLLRKRILEPAHKRLIYMY